VVCDKLYAPKHNCALGFERLALHAKSLTFSLLDGERVVVNADLSEDFENALRILKAV
jgi:23S rRNA-/tRNA-specific pseudouridylate synthase